MDDGERPTSRHDRAWRGRLTGIVPAAGYATRLQPLTGSKEMCLIAGKPVMDFLIERMVQATCHDIRVVTRPEKTDVIRYAERRGLTVVRSHPASVSESFLAGLEGTAPDDVVLLGFPDTIWEPSDGFVRLLDALNGFEVALSLFQGADPERSDVVRCTDAGIVTSIQVKPSRPASTWIWGFAVARRRALDALSTHPEPGVVFDAICRTGSVVGVRLSGRFVDIGTPEALEAYLRAGDG